MDNACIHCGALLCSHHKDTCIYWGQVVPSETNILKNLPLVVLVRKNA